MLNLRAFFRARFGKRWRVLLCRRLGRRLPEWLLGYRRSKWPSMPLLDRYERLAMALGYRPGKPPQAFKDERNRMVSLNLTHACKRYMLGLHLRPSFQVLFNALLHKDCTNAKLSDVLPRQSFVFIGLPGDCATEAARTAGPVCQGPSLPDLLDEPIAQAPGGSAPPKGGQKTPHNLAQPSEQILENPS